MNRPVWIVLLTLTALATAASAMEGLLHHWNFDEGPDWHDDAFGTTCSVRVARDMVGTADATLEGMGPAAWVSGRQFTALAFEGSNGRLVLTQDLAESLGGSATLSFWLRTAVKGSPTADTAPGVCGRAGKGVQWGWIDEEGRAVVSVDGSPVARTALPVNDGRWHHVVLGRNASTGEGYAFLDGLPSPALPTRAPGIRSRAFTSIGRIDSGASFVGMLDQLYIFDRALSPRDVLVLRDNHAPKLWPTRTEGTGAKSFTTDSVLYRAYDPEQDTLRISRYSPAIQGRIKSNGDGSFLYTPRKGWVGTERIDVVVTDGRFGFASGTLEIELPAPAPAGRSFCTTHFQGLADATAVGRPLQYPGMRCPRAVDWDRDGDLDLLIGATSGVWFHENTGSKTAPVFAEGQRVQAGGAPITGSGALMIALSDLTGDGRADLIVSDGSRQLRVFETQSGKGPVSLAEGRTIEWSGQDQRLPDVRFDLADVNGDGCPDLVTGTRSSEVRLYLNQGTRAAPRFDLDTGRTLRAGSYNLYPRLIDLNRDGTVDYVQGVNWGSIHYQSIDAIAGLSGEPEDLVIRETDGQPGKVRERSDGAIVDFADLNGDGVLDLIMGGHSGDRIAWATGERLTVAERIQAVDRLYARHADRLGAALDENDQSLLREVRDQYASIVKSAREGTYEEREQVFLQLQGHIDRHPFLRMDRPADTNRYRHIPGIAGQHVMTLQHILPDHPAQRARIADTMALTGLWRTVYLESGLHVGDNQRGSRGQLESVQDLMRYHPRVLFPDAAITLDHYFGDGRGGWFEVFTSAKNTFSSETGGDVSEDGPDLNEAVQRWYGAPVNRGDYFTFVMGHEVTHSLDGYVRSRANRDLQRRWGLMLCRAAGADVVPQPDGWPDWKATKARFKERGYWNGTDGSWGDAWETYWRTGPGKGWRDLSFMRGNIGWFMHAPQESLATQANQYFAHSEARLIGALDRFRRGSEESRPELKANLHEVALFMDFLSAGLNKMVLYDTVGTKTPYPRAEYRMSTAWLERNNQGRIIGIRADDRIYDLVYDVDGVCTGVTSTVLLIESDRATTAAGQPVTIDVLANDRRWEGGKPKLRSLSPAPRGSVRGIGDGRVVYTPQAGMSGTDRFAYRVDAGHGIIRTGQVEVVVTP